MKAVSPTSVEDTGEASSIRPFCKGRVAFHVVWEARHDVRIMRSATALIQAGYDVSIVDIVVDRALPAKTCEQGVHFQHIVIPDWQTSRRFEPLFFVRAVQALCRSTARLVREKADVYHASDLNALPASCLAALLRRKPLVVDIYDLQFPTPETRIGFWRRAGSLIAFMHNVVLPRCAVVIATSPLHAEAIRRRFHLKRVSLLRNILPYQKVQKSDRLREYLELAPHVQIALYQGGLQPDRELDRLVRAAPYLNRDVVIVLMGKSRGTTQQELEALIESEGVSERVRIIPPVPFEGLLEWTASADIGLIVYSPDYSPNIQMCLPNKLFEFLMSGLPVLVSQLDAITEIIQAHDVGRVVSTLSPQDIGRAINTMLSDRAALTRMSSNALHVAQEEFHWEKESQKLVQLYANILEHTTD